MAASLFVSAESRRAVGIVLPLKFPKQRSAIAGREGNFRGVLVTSAPIALPPPRGRSISVGVFFGVCSGGAERRRWNVEVTTRLPSLCWD